MTRSINIFSTLVSIAFHIMLVLLSVDIDMDNQFRNLPDHINIDISIVDLDLYVDTLQGIHDKYDNINSEEIVDTDSNDLFDLQDQDNINTDPPSIQAGNIILPEDNSISIVPQEINNVNRSIKYTDPEYNFDTQKSQRQELLNKISSTWSCPPLLLDKSLTLTLKVEIQNKRLVFTILNKPKHVTKEWEAFARSAIRAAIKSCKDHNSCITENAAYIFKFGYKNK